MPLPVLVKTLIEKKVGEFCTKKVSADVLDKLRCEGEKTLEFEIQKNPLT